jgi:uncharacterized protein
MVDAQSTPPAPGQPQTQTAAVTQEEKTWALFAHLSSLSGLLIGVGIFLGPLVVWLIGKEKGAFIDHHGKEALNFGITMAIALLVSAILIIVLIGIVLIIVVGITWIVLTIMATIKASNGEEYRYPISIRFVK